jgi:5-methylcytosine-specific restriction endonuclease McrA
VTYLKGFLIGLALWIGVVALVLAGLRTGDNRLLLIAAAVVLVFLLAWRRLWRRRRRPSSHRIPVPPAIRRQIYARDRYTCVYCGRRGRRLLLSIDHVFPVALGGTNDVGNLVTACRACNLTKGARLLDTAGLRRFTQERHAWAGRERRRGCLLRLLLLAACLIAIAFLLQGLAR